MPDSNDRSLTTATRERVKRESFVENVLILAVLVVEDVIIAFFLAVVGTLLLTGDASTGETVGTVAIALAALVVFGLFARRLSRLLSRALERLEREFFILGTGAIVVHGKGAHEGIETLADG